MRAKKKDSNHKAIAAEFESLGCWVSDTSTMGNGYPDMLVYNFGGCNAFFVEAKSKYGKRNPAQVKFAENCPMPVYVIRTTEQVRNLVIHNRYEEATEGL